MGHHLGTVGVRFSHMKISCSSADVKGPEWANPQKAKIEQNKGVRGWARGNRNDYMGFL